MDNRTNILPMLGLALRGSHLTVGEEPVEAVARARDARVLLLASDAADNTRRRCRHFAEAGQCLYLTIPYTKEELGQVLGRSSVAICALTDVGMAASFVHKLAALDPARYGEAAERLDVKAKRAAERKSEMMAHEKNIRQGKRKPHKEAPAKAEIMEEAPVEEKPFRKPYPPRKPGFSQNRGGQRRGDGWKPRENDSRREGWKPRNNDGRKSGEQRPYGDRNPYGEKSGDFRKSDRPYGDKKPYTGKSRPSKANRPKSKGKYNPYAHSLPVKKGKGSFRKKED